MQDDTFSLKILSLFALAGIGMLVSILVQGVISHDNVKVVFCDVGQGDAIYIRTDDGIDVLIDAGKPAQVLDCLGKEMPWFDRSIDIAIISHADYDHYGGFLHVLESYNVQTFIMPHIGSSGYSYTELVKKASEGVRMSMQAGQSFRIGENVKLMVYWPTENVQLSDTNAASYIFKLTYGTTDVMFTGDAGPNELAQTIALSAKTLQSEILKVPHHGSHDGLTHEFLTAVNPELSIISAGGDNRYGHPHDSIITMLENSESQYLSTAEEGSIRIILKKDSWMLKQYVLF